uniref:NADH dehydrogenase subunit 6 n=1 Tax=Mastax latefasciata TaxID=2962404 RepID=UPI0021150224|nr:NADH dehydrogenase subunit 6 [Mastax latefasciata]UTD45016.1 NADH dehydrogenase subunit 6 [Mastax latefasciata]
MLYFLMFLNSLMSLIFLFMNHPLSMGFILMIQTIIISMLTGMMSYSYWFSYILFMIMIGGMLILFMYMTSIASNEMFNFSIKLTYLMLIMFIFFMLNLFFIDNFNFSILLKNSNLIEYNNIIKFMNNENLPSLNKLYNSPINYITIMMINYLLLALIAIVKIINIKSGPLRQKF